MLDHSKSVDFVEGESKTHKGLKKSIKPKKKGDVSFKKNVNLILTVDSSQKLSPSQHERVS